MDATSRNVSRVDENTWSSRWIVYPRPNSWFTYLYLGEIVQQIKHDIGIDIAAMVCRLLKKHGHTRKKIHQIAKQKYATLREKFMAHISLFDGEAFVWLDETGTDRRDQLRKYGYALRGVTPVYHRILIRGDRYQWHSHTRARVKFASARVNSCWKLMRLSMLCPTSPQLGLVRKRVGIWFN